MAFVEVQATLGGDLRHCLGLLDPVHRVPHEATGVEAVLIDLRDRAHRSGHAELLCDRVGQFHRRGGDEEGQITVCLVHLDDLDDVLVDERQDLLFCDLASPPEQFPAAPSGHEVEGRLTRPVHVLLLFAVEAEHRLTPGEAEQVPNPEHVAFVGSACQEEQARAGDQGPVEIEERSSLHGVLV